MTFNIDEMSVLDRRRIEAGVLGPVFRAFAEGDWAKRRPERS